MDSLSQYLMGAAMGQLVLGPKHQGKGALMGGIAGTLPDLDIIPLMGSSVVDQLVHHRGITHSILFCLIAPIAFAWISRRFIKWDISFNRWMVFWGLAFFTHVLLDLMTTWGTQIFWPYSARFSLDSLFIIDPFVTFPLLIGCCWARWIRHWRPAFWGVMITSLYMVFAVGAHWVMKQKFTAALMKQSISIQSMLVRPTPFNTMYWGITARTFDDQLIMGYARLWDSADDVSLSLPIDQHSDRLDTIRHQQDVQVLLVVTKGYYVIDYVDDNVLIQDARYGRMGGWDNVSGQQFVFNYIFDHTQNEWVQYRRPMTNRSQQLKSLIQQIFD